MRFHVIHKLLSYLLAVAAVGTLMTTGAVPLPTVALLLVAGVASWFVEPSTLLGRLLDKASLVFNIGALSFFALSLYEVIRSFPEPDLTPILNLVLFLLVYKLFHRRSNRDYLQLYILSFLVVLAGAWLAQGVVFVAGFAIYVVLATWTLILFHLRHEIEDNYLVKHLPESATEKVTAARVLNSRRVVGKSFFLVTGLVSMAVLAGAALVFAAVPRIGLGFLTGAVRRKMTIVGFSDEVTLGQHGVLSSSNDTVVLRVEVPRLAAMTDEELRDRTISRLYWRGTVYDQYIPPQERLDVSSSGGEPVLGKWSRSGTNLLSTILRRVDMTTGNQVHVVVSPQAPGPATEGVKKLMPTWEKQVIQVLGLSTPVAFALDRPMAYEMTPPALGSFVTTGFHPRWSGEVALHTARVLPSGRETALPEFNGGQYVAYSRIGPRLDENAGLPQEDVPEDQLRPYLAVPRSLSQRVIDLGKQITKDAATPIDKVTAVMQWLKTTHRYTVDLKRDTRVVDPLEDFLFHQKTGHCEYFASSAAILLRIGGIPTRYVNGFLGGEWNDLGKHLTVPHNRAHSWVEAYLGKPGWVRVDATPVLLRISRMGRIRQVLDSIELFWSRWVIQYDASRQIDIAKRIGRQLGMEKARRGRRGPAAYLPDKKTVAGVVIGLAVVLTAWRVARKWRRRGPKSRGLARVPRGGPPVFRLYQKTLDRLSKRGWTRRLSETPTEFATRLNAAKVYGVDAVERLTELYVGARYGDRGVPDEALAALAAELDQVARPPAPPPQQQPPGAAAA